MDKKVLRNVIAGLTEGDRVTLNFRSGVSMQSGNYVFEGSRKGRGKGGSLLAEFTRVDADGNANLGEVVEVGTPKNDQLLNVVVGDVMHGYETEKEVPVFYETNAGVAASLKESFRVFLEDNACPKSVDVVSTEAKLNGTFTVTSARQMRGRGGQVVLETAEGVELWSYRHSGVIQEFRVS